MGNILDKKETENQWDAWIEYYMNTLDDEEHAIVEHFINSHPRENIFEEITSVFSKVMIEKVKEYLRPALKDFYKTKSKSKNNSFSYVIMRSDLSSVLSDEGGWTVYTSFKIAAKTARNFCGVATPLEEARRIINDNLKEIA